nr:MIT C-terminal domain-containing protein [Thiorhodococcus mannitoliphagus]
MTTQGWPAAGPNDDQGRKITLITSYDDKTDLKEMASRLDELKQSLLEIDIQLDIKVNENLHDREIRIDNGWIIKIGRGLDFYQKPDSWYGIGSTDLSLEDIRNRKCLIIKMPNKIVS